MFIIYNSLYKDVALPSMIKEHKFWMRKRSVKIEHNGLKLKLNTFNPDNHQPRPESHSEVKRNKYFIV